MINIKYCICVLVIAVLAGCDKHSLPSLSDVSNQNIKSITIQIPTEGFKYNKVRTDNKLCYSDLGGYKHYVNTKAVLADYATQETGTIKTAFYSQLILPEDNFSFGDRASIEIDSAYLALDYASDKIENTFYGDTSSKFSFKVNVITNDLRKEDVPYFSNTSLNYDSNDISQGDFLSISPGTKIKVPNIENGKKLEDKEVDSHIRIKISNDYVLNKFLLADKSHLQNQDEFVKYFKGFRITAEKQSASGGLINFSTYNTGKQPLRLIIYYHEKTANGNYYKEAELPLANASEASKGIFYSYIKNDISQDIDSNNIHLIPLSGLKAKLDFTNLYNTFETYKNKIIINSAELVADLPQENTNTDPLPSSLTINRGQNNEGNTIELPDGNSSDYRPLNNLDGTLRKADKLYKFNLQKTVYDLLTNSITGSSIFLDIANPQSAINIIKLNSAMYLKIIYTIAE